MAIGKPYKVRFDGIYCIPVRDAEPHKFFLEI